MFTTGSKLFLGGSTLALTGTLIYAISQDNSTLGTLGLIAATIVFVGLTAFNFWVRDSNVSAMDTAGIESSSAATKTPTGSLWPLVGGLGAALVPVGLIVGRAITWIAVIVIFIAAMEWMVQSWSERASADAEYNASIRRRILHPLELPVLGAVGLGIVIFSFSRIMLWLPSTGGAIAFGLIAIGVLAFGTLIAAKRNVARSLVAVLCVLGAVGIVGAGVASAIDGGRTIEKHELLTEETCTAEPSEADEHGSRAISAKANLAAEIILERGQLRAKVIGVNGSPAKVTLPRSLDSYIKFTNKDDGERRLLVELGDEVLNAGTDDERTVADVQCTQLVDEGGVQFIIVKPTRPSFSSDEPFTFSVPGVDGAELEIEVP